MTQINIRNKSIALIVVIILVVIASTLMITIGISSYTTYKNYKWRELKVHNKNLANQCANSLALPLWNFDRNQIGRIVSDAMRNKDVKAIVIKQNNPNKIIEVMTRNSKWEAVSTTVEPSSAGFLSTVRNIMINDDTIGSVNVLITPEFVQAHLQNIFVIIILIIALLAIVLILTLYFLLWNIVLKPLKLLEQFAIEVSKGDLKKSNVLTNRFCGELESLRTSISTMITLLESRYELQQIEIKRTQESENLFRILIQSIPDLVWLKDPNGNYLACNPPFERYFGAKESEIRGKSDVDFVNSEQAKEFRDSDLRVILTNELSVREVNITYALDNQLATIETVKVPMYGIEGNLIGILGIARDITEKKKIEEELKKHRTQLEQLVSERTTELASANGKLVAANEALINKKQKLQTALDELHAIQQQLIHSEKMASIGILSEGIAHEINNPLNFIQGGLLGIEDYFETHLQDHLQEVSLFTSAISAGIERASEIVSSLSHYSRRDETTNEACDIHAIIDNCLVMLQNQIRGKVEVKKKYTEKYCLVLGNEGKLHQAILNIIVNAEQAIDDQGIINITSEVSQNMLILEISDSGHGISAENLQKIFDPFFTTKDAGKGTGLGLSITYNIIQEYNGSIIYESKSGIGTIVTIKFPIIKISEL